MYRMTVKRFELGHDNKGRRTTLETEVAEVSLTSKLQQALNETIKEDYEKFEGVNIDYDVAVGDDGHEYEITGALVIKILNKFCTVNNNLNFNEIWKEDGINSKGEPFRVEDTYYIVEIW